MDIRDLIKQQHEKFLKVAKFMPGTPSSFADNLDKAYIKGLTDMRRSINFIDVEKLNLLAYDLSSKEATKWWEDAMNKWSSLPKEEQKKYRQLIGFNGFPDVLLNKMAYAYKAGYYKAKEEQIRY